MSSRSGKRFTWFKKKSDLAFYFFFLTNETARTKKNLARVTVIDLDYFVLPIMVLLEEAT